MSEINPPQDELNPPERSTDSAVNPPEPSVSEAEPVAQPSSRKITALLTPAEAANLITQMQQLRQHNTELVNWGMQLEAELDVAKRSLEEYKRRSPVLEALLVQRQEEVDSLTAQNTKVLKELESSHQTAQRQQILVETLTEQLETSQQQVAQLERECALLQQRCNEQATLLLQASEACREMRSRLYRQQRYTLQFKTALEKSLEVSETTYTSSMSGDTPVKSSSDPRLLGITWGFVPKPPAIQPWSAPIPLFEEEEESSGPDLTNLSANLANLEAYRQRLATPETTLEATLEPETLSFPPPKLVESPVEMILEDDAASTPLVEVRFVEADDLELATAPESLAELSESVTESLPMEAEEELPPVESESLLEPITQPNWPSPLVYPLRPQKKIKSLAAIDLPSFPRRGPSLGST